MASIQDLTTIMDPGTTKSPSFGDTFKPRTRRPLFSMDTSNIESAVPLIALGTALADGPLPIGDIIALGILGAGAIAHASRGISRIVTSPGGRVISPTPGSTPAEADFSRELRDISMRPRPTIPVDTGFSGSKGAPLLTEKPETIGRDFTPNPELEKATRGLTTFPGQIINKPTITRVEGINNSRVPGVLTQKGFNKGTKQQVIGMLKGIPKAEREAMELNKLPDRVTRDEVIRHVQARIPKVREIWKVRDAVKSHEELLQEATEERARELAEENGEIWENLDVEVQSEYEDQAYEQMNDEDTLGIKPYSAKYASPAFNIPGGTNYRELVLQASSPAELAAQELSRYDILANKGLRRTPQESSEFKQLVTRRNELFKKLEAKQEYYSSHWNEPNPIAHIRMDDRTVGKKKGLFIQEVQSDWNREAREKGFKPREPLEYSDQLKDLAQEREFLSEVTSRDSASMSSDEMRTNLNRMEEIDRFLKSHEGTVPFHPLVKNYDDLAVKKMLEVAVREGKNFISWTTGEQQAERYDLSKHLDSVTMQKMSRDRYKVSFTTKQGDSHSIKGGEWITVEDVRKELGKDFATKAEQLDSIGKTKRYSGLDLKVGGESHKVHYDTILPKLFEKHAGRKVKDKVIRPKVTNSRDKFKENLTIEAREYYDEIAGDDKTISQVINIMYDQFPDGWNLGDEKLKDLEKDLKVHYLEITPAVKERVKKGLFLFSESPKTTRRA